MGVPALLPLPFVGPPTTQFAVDDWNARLGSVCGSFHTRAPAGVVRGSVSMQPVLGIDIASINVGPSQIVRSQQDANRDGSAYYFLIAQRASQVQVLHKNRSTLLQAGDLVLVDSSQQSDFIYTDVSGTGMSSQFSVHIPRQFLADSVAGQHIGEKIPAQSAELEPHNRKRKFPLQHHQHNQHADNKHALAKMQMVKPVHAEIIRSG